MSKVGDLVKVNTPPGTIGHLKESGATENIPFWDEDLPNKDINEGDPIYFDPPTEERSFATNIQKKTS